MRKRAIGNVLFGFAAVLFAYGVANAQVVDAIKDAASKTKDVTARTVQKTSVIVTDGLEKAADRKKDTTVDAAKKTASASQKIGNYSVDVSENIAVKSFEGGKWFTVTTWDGTKWVSKKTWHLTKKAATATKDAVTNQ